MTSQFELLMAQQEILLLREKLQRIEEIKKEEEEVGKIKKEAESETETESESESDSESELMKEEEKENPPELDENLEKDPEIKALPPYEEWNKEFKDIKPEDWIKSENIKKILDIAARVNPGQNLEKYKSHRVFYRLLCYQFFRSAEAHIKNAKNLTETKKTVLIEKLNEGFYNAMLQKLTRQYLNIGVDDKGNIRTWKPPKSITDNPVLERLYDYLQRTYNKEYRDFINNTHQKLKEKVQRKNKSEVEAFIQKQG
jgi:hypothetical protein